MGMKSIKALPHFYLFMLLSILMGVSRAMAECHQGWTDIPPYYSYTASDTEEEHFFLYGKEAKTGKNKRAPASVGKIFENYPQETNYKLIKKNTMVKPVLPLSGTSSADDLILVDIMNQNESSNYLQGLIGTNTQDKIKEYSLKGQRGFLSAQSLSPSSTQDILFVKKDTVILPASDGLGEMILKYGEGLRPVMQDKMYKVMNCDDKFTYLFELISPEMSRHSKEIEVTNMSCFENQIMTEKSFNEVQGLLNHLNQKNIDPSRIEINEWGLSRLIEDPDKAYVHFTGPDSIGTDDWAKPDTLCSLMDIAKDWKKNCAGPGCALQIGDMSFPTPAVLENGRDPLGHLQHSDGTCIDMRPFRKDRKMEGVNLKYSFQEYDRVRTKKFIQFLISSGATPVYFNDSQIVQSSNPGRKRKSCDLKNPKNDEKQGVFSCEGHSDHIHFCLKKPYIKGC